MNSISVLKETIDKQNTNFYELRDNNAIRSVIFNNTKCPVKSNGEVVIKYDVDNLLTDNDVCKLKKAVHTNSGFNKVNEMPVNPSDGDIVIYIGESIDNYIQNHAYQYSSSSWIDLTSDGFIAEPEEGVLYATKEENGLYSLISKIDGIIVKLSHSEYEFETEDIDFNTIVDNDDIAINKKMFTSWNSLYDFLNEKDKTGKYINFKTVNIKIGNENISEKNAYVYISKSHPSRNKYAIILTSNDNKNVISAYNINKIIEINIVENKEIKEEYYATTEELFTNILLQQYNEFSDVEKSSVNQHARRLYDPRMEVMYE